MALFIRMVIYLIAGMAAGHGILVFDDSAGTITIQIEDIVSFIVGLITFVGTFFVSRIAKARGGKT